MTRAHAITSSVLHVMGRDSALRYALRVWKARHARYATLPASDALVHARVTHLRSDAVVRDWVERWPSR